MLSADECVIVTGLPRSGTSMIMQMLAAGGMPVLSDRLREADEDNPRGYFEFEAAKRFLRDQSWLAEARGQAVKIVAPLVNALPAGGRFRIILIERDCDEILDSQAKMLARRGEAGDDTPARRELLKTEYRRILDETKQLVTRSEVRMLLLRHDDVIRRPRAAAHAMARFLGATLDESRMAAAVDPALYRNQKT